MQSDIYNFLWHIKKRVNDKELLSTCYELHQNQSLSPEKLHELQLSKLSRILKHAYENVPFYQKKFNQLGLLPEDISDFKIFSTIPVLTKQDIREHFNDLIATNIPQNRRKKSFTGGSTGIPLAVYHDRANSKIFKANNIRFLNWIGVKPGDKTAYIWGLNKANTNQMYKQQSSFNRFFSNRVALDAFDMNPKKMKEFAFLLQKFRPKVIISYVTALYEFAHFLNENEIKLISPSVIVLTAERTGIFQKKLIEDVFRATVFDFYGSCEINWYASESTFHEGLHIFADLRYIEFLDKNNNILNEGQEGRIVVTDLENYAFPLIRYENGDEGSLKKLYGDGDIKFPVMNPIKGRISDSIILPSGRIIHGEYFTHIFYELVDKIEKFQVHQKSINSIVIHLVTRNGYTQQSIIDMLETKFSDIKCFELKIIYNFSSVIPNERSGKYRFVKSDIKSHDL